MSSIARVRVLIVSATDERRKARYDSFWMRILAFCEGRPRLSRVCLVCMEWAEFQYSSTDLMLEPFLFQAGSLTSFHHHRVTQVAHRSHRLIYCCMGLAPKPHLAKNYLRTFVQARAFIGSAWAHVFQQSSYSMIRSWCSTAVMFVLRVLTSSAWAAPPTGRPARDRLHGATCFQFLEEVVHHYQKEGGTVGERADPCLTPRSIMKGSESRPQASTLPVGLSYQALTWSFSIPLHPRLFCTHAQNIKCNCAKCACATAWIGRGDRGGSSWAQAVS